MNFIVESLFKHPVLPDTRQAWFVTADNAEDAAKQIVKERDAKGVERRIICVTEIKERQEPILLSLSLT